MKRLSLLVLPLLALIFLGAGCFTTTVNVAVDNANQNANTNQQAPENFSVPVTITSGQSDPVQLEVIIQNGSTALDVLKKAGEDQNLAIETKTYDFGDLVQGIGGVKADEKHFWSFYVNDTPASVGAGEYKPQSGDRIEFRFEAM